MATYYIATDGDDSNSGLSLAAPWLHIEKINAVNLLPGDVVNIRAGTYDSYSPLFATAFYNIRINAKNGTAGSHITIQGYPPDFTGGGRVVYNCLNVARTSGGIGICTLDCSYIDFFRISVVGPAQEVAGGSGTYAAAWWFSANTSKTNVTATNCEASFSMTGFRLDNVNSATYTNCDAHDIDDPFTGPPTGAHNNSDGFSRTNALNTATGTVYNGCRAWYCADDGWDCFGTSGTITYNNCWSFKNGYNSSMVHLGDGNGFKMGSAASTGNTRFAYNNLAYGNYVHGFDQNAGNFVAVFYNNSAINNGGNDWKFGYNPPLAHVFRNNLSYGNAAIDGTSGDAADWGTNDFNSWNGGVTLTTDDFVSLDDTQFDDTRQADGSLPVITAFHLASDSDLIDAGVDVGLPFNGAAPDMGAFEFGDPLPEGTITELTIAFTECDDGTTGGYQIFYRVSGDEEWIDGGIFFSSPAVITGLSYPSGTVFDVQGVNTDCDEESGSGDTSITADNGLNMGTPTNVQLGGDLLHDTAVTSNGFQLVLSGLTLEDNGAAQLTQYGSGTFTGTLAFLIGEDSAGNLIEIDPDDISGSGSGSGASMRFGYPLEDTQSLGEDRDFEINGHQFFIGDFNVGVLWDNTIPGLTAFSNSGGNNYFMSMPTSGLPVFSLLAQKTGDSSAQIQLYPDTGDGSVRITGTDTTGAEEIFISSSQGINFQSSGVANTVIFLRNIPVFANEAAAVTGGLGSTQVYQTSTGELRIKL